MKPLPFSLELKKHSSPGTWPWLLTALRQDPWIWAALEASDLGQQALETLGQEPSDWTPAALGLLAIGGQVQSTELTTQPMQPVEEELQLRADRVYQTWLATGPQPLTPGSLPDSPDQALSNCALIALAIRERYRENSAWRGIFSVISLDRLETRTVLACLYGIIAEPERLVLALAEYGNGHPRPDLALHTLLCQPLPPDQQAKTLNAVQDHLSPVQRHELLNKLAAQRPGLALGMAGDILAIGDDAWSGEIIEDNTIYLSRHFDQLASSVRLADCYQVAGQPDRAVPLLAETLRLVRRLRGHLSARLAQVVSSTETSNDTTWRETAQETSLEAWKQAVQLIPEDPRYVAGLAHTLVNAGRLTDAQSYLAGHQTDGDYHPSISLTSAILSARQDDLASARRHALQALRLVESGQGLSINEHIDLARFFTRYGMPAEAVRAAQAALIHYPLNLELLTLLAQAQFDLGQAELALSAAFVIQANSSSEGDDALESLIVTSLESVGAWEMALDIRLARLQKTENPMLEDLHAVMRCAEKAGQYDILVETSRRAVELDPEDVLALHGLAAGALAVGNSQEAIGHLVLATQLAPDQAMLWLSLVGAYRQAGDETRAMETLRSASQALPERAEIHAALGEAYLSQGAPTQALSCFRLAAKLSPSQHYALRLGQTLYQLGHLAEACNVLGEAYQAARSSQDEGAADHDMVTPSTRPELELAHSYARALLASKQAEQAIPLMVEVARARPDDPEAGIDLSRALLLATDQPINARRAVPFLHRILALNPDGAESGYHGNLDDKPALRAEARALLAEAYAITGEWDKAMEAYRRALDDPLNRPIERQTRLSTGLGLVALKLEQPEMAVAALEEAARAEPLNPQVQKTLSEAYLANGLAPDAYQAASILRDLQPDDLATQMWFIEQGLKLVDRPGINTQQLWQEIIQSLKAATKLAPERADLHLRLGRILADDGDPAGALDAFRRMAETEASHQAIPIPQLYQIARTVRELGDAILAVQLLEQSIVKSYNGETENPPAILADLLAELSLAQYQAGNSEQALIAVDKALAVDEDRAALHVHKAVVLQHDGQLNQALESLRNAVRLSPRDPELRLHMAELLTQRGDLPSALEQVEKGLAILTDSGAIEDDARLGLRLNLQAAVLSKATLRSRQALEYLQSAMSPEEPVYDAFSNAALRAELCLDTGDLAVAEQAADVLKQIASDHPRTHAIAARVAHRRHEEDKRDQHYREALSLLDQFEEKLDVTTLASKKEDYLFSFLSTAQAALDCRKWDEALAVLDRLTEIIPETPVAYYLQAQVLVARGEAQMLFRDLEVTRRVLDPETLSEATWVNLSQNLAEAQRLLAVQVSMDTIDDLKPWRDECHQKLSICMARGKALFQPEVGSALVLQSLLQTATPEAAEVAALVIAFRRSGEAESAVRAAQVGWRPLFEGDDVCVHPLVLAQVALAESDASLAIADVEDAMKSTNNQGEGWPQMPMLQYLHAWKAFQAGEFSKALISIQNALAAWPDESRWQELAGRIYLGQEQSAGLPDKVKAMSHLERAVALEPERASTHLMLGQLYLENGEALRAVESLKEAVQLDPTQPKAWLAMAQAQYSSGDFEQAAMSADHAIEADADLPDALLLRGRISLQTNNPRGALSRAQAILRSDPTNADAIYLLSQALEALSRPTEALLALEKALALSPNPQSMQIERVHLVRRSKGLEAGVTAIQELVAKNPHQPVFMALLAEWLSEAGRSEAAIQAARLALQEENGELSDEQRARLHILIGLRMRSTGQLDQAIHHLDEAVAQAPSNLEAYLELGRAYQERREYRQALKICQRAMTIANNDYRPYYQAGLVLKDNKDYVAAEAMLRRAAQLAPNEVSVHRLLGAVVALNLVHNRRLTPLEH